MKIKEHKYKEPKKKTKHNFLWFMAVLLLLLVFVFVYLSHYNWVFNLIGLVCLIIGSALMHISQKE